MGDVECDFGSCGSVTGYASVSVRVVHVFEKAGLVGERHVAAFAEELACATGASSVSWLNFTSIEATHLGNPRLGSEGEASERR